MRWHIWIPRLRRRASPPEGPQQLGDALRKLWAALLDTGPGRAIQRLVDWMEQRLKRRR